MILMMMHLTALRLLARRSTEPRGASFALFLFGVLMPKGQRAPLGHGSYMGGLFAVGLVSLFAVALSSVLWTYPML